MTDTIAQRLQQIRATVPDGVSIVAVSKFHLVEALRQAYDAGQRIFGESRQQELLQKIPQMPSDVRWHFIGHLQTNKVRSLIGHVAMIESVDSERLLRLIDDESRRAGVTTDVLLQVHVAREETKFGFLPEELTAFFANGAYRSLTNTRLRGIMGMASNIDDQDRVTADFRAIASLFSILRASVMSALSGPSEEPGKPDVSEHSTQTPIADFDTISMGMSHDYPLAIACGSNMVRIGTAIFGDRQY